MRTEDSDKDWYFITGFSVGNKNESLVEMEFKCVVQEKKVTIVKEWQQVHMKEHVVEGKER